MQNTRSRLRRRLILLAAPLLITSAGLVPLGAATPAEAATTTWLPFDQPTTSTLRSSSKKVFANWVSSLPVSLDNKDPKDDYYQRNYLSPAGEGGKHKAYGGFLRDRPLGRAPLGADWRLQDMKSEVRQAIAAGIDGFTVVIYGFPAAGKTTAQWTNTRLMMQAAAEVDSGFKIIAMTDMTSPVANASAATVASRMAELGKFSSVYKVDGKMVLSPFATERKSVDYWKSVISTMSGSYGTPVTFFPCFLDEQKYGPSFSAMSYGMGNWGNRDPAWNNPDLTYSTGPIGRIGKVHARGDKWMQPVSFQDERPREGRYFEAANTENLRNSWAVARKGNAEWAQMTTWNDWPEGSGMQPSAKHGYNILDLNAYYISWFKTGVAPTITRDAVYLTHRKHKLAAKATYPQTKFMTNRDGGTAGRDTVEALTFARSAGTVQVTVGGKTTSCAVPAGVGSCTVPLNPGTVSAKLIRGGTTTASLTSPYPVTSSPYVQDFEYTASGSLRNGTTAAGPAPAPVPIPAPAGSSTKVLFPAADSFVDKDLPTRNEGGSYVLAVDGLSAKAAYLRFRMPAAPAGKTLVGASLKVHTNGDALSGSPGTYNIQVASNSWKEGTVVWNNRPAATSGTIGQLKGPKSKTFYNTTLTAGSLSASQGADLTLSLSGTNPDGIFVASANNPVVADRPQLTLTYK